MQNTSIHGSVVREDGLFGELELLEFVWLEHLPRPYTKISFRIRKLANGRR